MNWQRPPRASEPLWRFFPLRFVSSQRVVSLSVELVSLSRRRRVASNASIDRTAKVAALPPVELIFTNRVEMRTVL